MSEVDATLITGKIAPGEKIMMAPMKMGAPMTFTQEIFFAPADHRRLQTSIMAATLCLTREVAEEIITPPTAEAIAEYERLKALLEEIEASLLWDPGYDGGYLMEPKPTVERIYAETEDQFEARVRKAYAEFIADRGRTMKRLLGEEDDDE